VSWASYGSVAAQSAGPVMVTNQLLLQSPAWQRARVLRVVSAQVRGFTDVVGRGDLLDRLRQDFTGVGPPSSRPVLRVLTGLGGVGKTSVARAYAQRWQQEYRLIWWVRAEDAAAAGQEFRGLLDALLPEEASRVADPVQAVHTLLADRVGRWLLVLDNVPGPDALAGLVPADGAGDVLVTSRASNWPDDRQAVSIPPPLPAATR